MLKVIVIINFKYSGAIVIHDYSCIVYNVLTGTPWSNNINCNFCSPAYSERTIEPSQRRKSEPETQSSFKLVFIPSARLLKVFTREKTSATDNCTIVLGAFKKGTMLSSLQSSVKRTQTRLL